MNETAVKMLSPVLTCAHGWVRRRRRVVLVEPGVPPERVRRGGGRVGAVGGSGGRGRGLGRGELGSQGL